ncbi:MAG: MFS transporter, partial [Bacteroidales bacterium]
MESDFKGFKNIFGYSAGMAGWSIMLNTVSVMIVYFYLPPKNSGMHQLVPNEAVIGILTIFSLILASGRIIDAFTDPLIAWISDRLNTRWGRRVPL